MKFSITVTNPFHYTLKIYPKSNFGINLKTLTTWVNDTSRVTLPATEKGPTTPE